MNRYIVWVFVALLSVAVGACMSTSSGDQSGEPGSTQQEQGGETVESAASGQPESGQAESAQPKPAQPTSGERIEALPLSPEDPSLAIATFAGGCFWCVEPPFDKTEGVERTIVGYTGGTEQHPTYKQVASGQTSHTESIRVYYNPDKVSYDELLEVFWRNIDPTQKNGQFVDIGSQYRTAIFYHDQKQKELAEASKEALAKSGRFDKSIVTEIVEADTFWKAEEYHQNFYKKSPARYKSYRSGSGRDEFIERVWGDD